MAHMSRSPCWVTLTVLSMLRCCILGMLLRSSAERVPELPSELCSLHFVLGRHARYPPSMDPVGCTFLDRKSQEGMGQRVPQRLDREALRHEGSLTAKSIKECAKGHASYVRDLSHEVSQDVRGVQGTEGQHRLLLCLLRQLQSK